MGRFRVSEDDDDHESHNPFQAQHVYSSSSEEDDERSGIWRGPLVPLNLHRPQRPNNNGMDVPSPQDERDLGGSPIHPPSVSLRRSRRKRDDDDHEEFHDNNGMTMRPHYYSYDQPPRPAARFFSWHRVLAMVVVAHLLARYGPVAPPKEADSDSWEDFWVTELRGLFRSCKLIGYTVPKDALKWLFVGMHDDALFYYHQYQQHTQEQAQLERWSDCSLKIPEDFYLEYTHELEQDDPWYHIVGQSRAIQVATEALDAWKQSAPLLLYFSGSRGVGKLELARQVSLRIFGQCLGGNTSALGEEFFEGSSPVMMLQGRDFSFPPDDEDETVDGVSEEEGVDDADKRSFRNLRVQLYESILKHVERHPNGTAIVLQHVEDMADGLLAAFVQDLVNPSRHTSTEDDRAVSSHDYTNAQSLASRLQQACGKTVFMLTSTVGSKIIASNIRSYGGVANIPPLELDLALMHEVDTQFATTSTTSSQKKKQSYVDVGSKFHAVAPFFPLEEPSLKRILSQKASQWTDHQQSADMKFAMTEQAVNALLDPSRVEYLAVVKKSTKEPILTFSGSGAQMLNDGSLMMNAWQASVKRCLRASVDRDADDKIASPETVVLDYDTVTRQGLVLLCPPDATSKHPSGMCSVKQQDCEEKCSLTSL